MAYSASDLTAEIRAEIDERLASGEPARLQAIAVAVVTKHCEIMGADRDFHTFCAHHWVRGQVGKTLKGYRCTLRAEADPQLVLGLGYEHLQHAYAVEREGDEFVVRLDGMSKAELIAKRDELRAMAEGAVKHADEIDRYLIARYGAA
jgi:hypothetical protein